MSSTPVRLTGLSGDALAVLDLLPVGPATVYGIDASEIGLDCWPAMHAQAAAAKARVAVAELLATVPNVVALAHGHGLDHARRVRTVYAVARQAAPALLAARRQV